MTGRRVVTAFSFVSLALCLVTAMLWVRSYCGYQAITRGTPDGQDSVWWHGWFLNEGVFGFFAIHTDSSWGDSNGIRDGWTSPALPPYPVYWLLHNAAWDQTGWEMAGFGAATGNPGG